MVDLKAGKEVKQVFVGLHPTADVRPASAIWYADKGFSTPYPGESRVLLPAEVTGAAVNSVGPNDDD